LSFFQFARALGDSRRNIVAESLTTDSVETELPGALSATMGENNEKPTRFVIGSSLRRPDERGGLHKERG
jgi:hypothetical protein